RTSSSSSPAPNRRWVPSSTMSGRRKPPGCYGKWTSPYDRVHRAHVPARPAKLREPEYAQKRGPRGHAKGRCSVKFLVTGGAGYIGSVVTHLLLAEGHEVTVLDDLSTGYRVAVPAGVSFVDGRVHEMAGEVLDPSYD